jgi:hypothetical protein
VTDFVDCTSVDVEAITADRQGAVERVAETTP